MTFTEREEGGLMVTANYDNDDTPPSYDPEDSIEYPPYGFESSVLPGKTAEDAAKYYHRAMSLSRKVVEELKENGAITTVAEEFVALQAALNSHYATLECK